jgi:copper chaperone CopZ
VVCKIIDVTNEEHMSGSVVLSVSNMASNKCEETIKNATLRCRGVKDTRVSYEEGKAIINVNVFEVNVNEIKDVVEGIGYSVSTVFFNTEL